MYTVSVVDVKTQHGLTLVVDQILASTGRNYRFGQRPTAKPAVKPWQRRWCPEGRSWRKRRQR